MKRYSDLMQNGTVKCANEQCGYNYKGVCCHFASANENDSVNEVCAGEVMKDTMHQSPQVKFDAAGCKLTKKQTEEYLEMLYQLITLVDGETSKVLFSISQSLRSYSRSVPDATEKKKVVLPKRRT